MSMISSKARLGAATKELSTKWQETKEHWHDAKSQEFERKYLEDLQTSVDTAAGVMDQLDKLINKIRSDCE
jgi:phage shock protein A